mgnify:CR=1 FL=1
MLNSIQELSNLNLCPVLFSLTFLKVLKKFKSTNKLYIKNQADVFLRKSLFCAGVKG